MGFFQVLGLFIHEITHHLFQLQETQPRVRTIDLASKRRDEEERRRSSERENDDKTASEIDKDTEHIKQQKPNIFGSATPVDTSAREKEIEEKLKKQNYIILEKEKENQLELKKRLRKMQ